MEKFEDVQNNFKNTRNNFIDNVKDKVGISIDKEQLESIEQTIFKMKTIEDKVNIGVVNVDRILLEARAILPRI
ncbi:hypothetical protein [Aliarcobacter butzleri]|uniref:hypothetical protein n=1 Tax=Aliarcobacter butzleri TaxID=28197 RepID=UPI00102DFAB3|nr:hypothetical protein [Aliarcobacter butzleri]MCG3701573.1 hypothetical protein [Aliarcobacter butzleri]RZV16518.1 hypothetical protein D3M75_09535 [Aliarcobacter butzleri]